jgi:hypothetical protein
MEFQIENQDTGERVTVTRKPDATATSKPYYPYISVTTYQWENVTSEELPRLMEWSDERADEILEAAQNDDPERVDYLTTITYGYVWRGGEERPRTGGATIDGYSRFTNLEGEPFHVEAEVRLHDMES